jgi:ABC-type Fe3+/spermidine/putrescine transport system ATPase subunit
MWGGFNVAQPRRDDGGGLASDSTVPSVELEDVHKSYGRVEAVRGVSFTCRDGEFLTVLGPSGSGKTTILRLIAGFEQPTRAARLAVNGQSVIGVPSYKRDVSTVFQQYALFPHMTVGQNVEYSLKVRGVAPAERQRQAQAMLDLVRLGHTYTRRINQLSGGEQQRVALARALVARPGVLLLDEPLGALDEKLRREMQVELKQIQRQVGTSFVYVTHDQQEALAMSDRIVVMNAGLIEQIGSSEEVYERPATRFVASFLGTSNLLEGVMAETHNGYVHVDTAVGLLTAERPAMLPAAGAPVAVAVRPERIALADGTALRHETPALAADAAGPHNRLAGTVQYVVYKGGLSDVTVALRDGSEMRAALAAGEQSVPVGTEVTMSWAAAATRVLVR